MPDVFIVLGHRNSRKSSTVRALTGIGRRATYEIELLDGRQIQVYINVSSLQERPILPEAFIAEVDALPNQLVSNILFPLWIEAGNNMPDGRTYIETFVEAGWNIKHIEILGVDRLPYHLNVGPEVVHFIPNSKERPNNRNTYEIKRRWGWL